MAELKVFGIPTCGSCKKALAWLTENEIEHQFVNTRQNPPAKKQLSSWVSQVGNKPLRNTSGGSYRALGDEKKDWDDSQWIEAFSKDAMLIKRPVIVLDDKVIGVGFRNPDQVEAALSEAG